MRPLLCTLSVVLDFWVKWEELTLAAEFGDNYLAYSVRVMLPMPKLISCA